MSESKGNFFSHVGAAILGAAVGSVAVIMSDKKNRNKLKEQVDKVKKIGEQKVNEVKEKLEEVDAESSKKIAKKLDLAKKRLEKRGAKSTK